MKSFLLKVDYDDKRVNKRKPTESYLRRILREINPLHGSDEKEPHRVDLGDDFGFLTDQVSRSGRGQGLLLFGAVAIPTQFGESSWKFPVAAIKFSRIVPYLFYKGKPGEVLEITDLLILRLNLHSSSPAGDFLASLLVEGAETGILSGKMAAARRS